MIYRDVLVNNCSCIIDTSAIPGGRISVRQDDYRDVGDSECQEPILEQNPMMYMEPGTPEGHGELVLFCQFSILKSNYHKNFNHY